MKTAIPRKQPFDTRAWCETELLKGLDAWFVLQCRDPYKAFYLWHKPGALTIAANKPDGFELATGARLCPGSSKQQNFNSLRAIVYRLPILTPEML